jgi:hypothetical protein
VVAAVLVALVLVFALGGDDEPQRAGDQPPQTGNTVTDTQPAPDEAGEEPTAARKDVKVAVFNATTVNGLARRVADDIEAGGFTRDQVSNAPPPERSATIVFYAEGARAQARDVAEVIEVGGDAVQPMDQSTRVLDDDARVIVIVGADQQQSQQG